MLSSGVWAGAINLEEAWALPDINNPNVTLKSELERLDMLGSVTSSHDASNGGYPLGAHFELHIEQGPILERTGRKIGVVQGVQSYRWLTLTVTGRDAHTGTTPLDMRKDPLLAAAQMITLSRGIAQEHQGLASTGIFKTPANSSTNTIMSQVSFSLDIRHPDDAIVQKIHEECLSSFHDIARADGVQLEWVLDTDSPATKFDSGCIQTVEQVADNLVGKEGWLHITSGAGHDSVNTSRHCPTTMIFVPCKDGVSHHPEEYCSPEDW